MDILTAMTGVKVLLTSFQAQSTGSYFAYSCQLSLSGVGEAIPNLFFFVMTPKHCEMRNSVDKHSSMPVSVILIQHLVKTSLTDLYVFVMKTSTNV